MRALTFSEFGDPSVLKLAERPTPSATANTAVIQVKAASINPSDVKNVKGAMEGTVLPRVPGRDYSGVVVDGPKEWLGAEVWGSGGDIGFTVDGSHASHLVVPVAALARKPGKLSHEQAAAIGVNFIVAWLGAVIYGGIQSGETIVTVGAGGGVGGAVVQIAKSKGLRVIGADVRPIPPEAPAAKRLDAFVDSSQANWPQELMRLTAGKGADIVYDTVGGVMFEPSLQTLGKRGRLIMISATGKRRVEFDALHFYHQELQMFGADSRKLDVAASARILDDLAPGFERGDYDPPVIAAAFPLDKAQEAYTAVAKGAHGRVVLVP